MKECDLAAPVMNWLHSRGFTPYGEVPWSYRAIDIVGLTDDAIETVEMKLSLTKYVIYQANITLASANRAWCAVASMPRNLDQRVADGWLKNVGVLRVVDGRVEVLREAPEISNGRPKWGTAMREACAMLEPFGAAGMPTMLGVGPAQSVYNKVCEFRQQNPNAKWRDIFKAVPNHYTHFRSMQGAMRVVEEKRAARERRLAAKVAP